MTRQITAQQNSLTNYGGCFGQTHADTLTTRAAFGVNRGARIRDIFDGVSNTVLVSEVLTGSPNNGGQADYRGAAWIGNAGHGQFHTQLTPNSSSPDVMYPDNGMCSANLNLPDKNLPCVQGSSNGLDNYSASRSRHPGGVNSLLGDGSVRFISNNIDVTTWRNLGFIADGQTLGDF